jgi:hypothetical protein
VVQAVRQLPATQCCVPVAHSASVRQSTHALVVVSHSLAPQSLAAWQVVTVTHRLRMQI